MNNYQERRKEKRLYYDWPILFCREFEKDYWLGEILNISSTHIAFTCQTKHCPAGDETTTLRFSVPRYNPDGSFEKEDFTSIGRVSSARVIDPYTRLVVLKFEKPLSFKPGEQEVNTQTGTEAKKFQKV